MLQSETSQCLSILLILTQLECIMFVDVSFSLIPSSANSSKEKSFRGQKSLTSTRRPLDQR